MATVSTSLRPTVRPALPADLRFAAVLHRSALPHGFFARLGSRFLDAYYESFAVSPHGIALVGMLGVDCPAGVLVGTLRNAEHYRWVLRHRGPRLAWWGAMALATRPRLAATFARTRARRYLHSVRRLRRRASRPAGPRRPQPVAVLTHVCVAEAAREHGVGAALVAAFLDAATAGGAEEAQLVTLAGSEGAGTFYARQGWQHRGDHVDHDGRQVERYARPLA